MELIVAAISAAFAASVTLIGYWTSRKLGLSDGQKALVKTLQDTVSALNARVTILEEDKTKLLERIEHLEDDNIQLAGVNSRLRQLLSKQGAT